MPIYEYSHVEDAPAGCAERFERIESVAAEPLTACPTCGGAVRRVPTGFSHHRNVLAASNLKEKGFTRLKRRDKGAYEAD